MKDYKKILQIYWEETDEFSFQNTSNGTLWKRVHSRSYSGPYFPAFGLKTERYFYTVVGPFLPRLKTKSICFEFNIFHNNLTDNVYDYLYF